MPSSARRVSLEQVDSDHRAASPRRLIITLAAAGCKWLLAGGLNRASRPLRLAWSCGPRCRAADGTHGVGSFDGKGRMRPLGLAAVGRWE